MTAPTCETCRWCHVSVKAAETGYGSPVRFMKVYECRIRSVSAFPVRHPDEWCGEHAPKLSDNGNTPV